MVKTKSFTPVVAILAGYAVLSLILINLVSTHDLTSYFSWFSSEERKLKLALTTYILVVLTAITLWLFRKLLRLPLKWFWYTMLLNGLIIFVKFISAPNAYSDLPTDKLGLTALAVGALYIATLCLVYLFSRGELLGRLSKKIKNTGDFKLLFAAGLFLLANMVRIGVFSLPGLSDTATADYFSSVFQTGGVVLSGLLFLIIFSSVQAFSSVTKSVLAHIFYLEVGLIIIYHALWVIFVGNLGDCGC